MNNSWPPAPEHDDIFEELDSLNEWTNLIVFPLIVASLLYGWVSIIIVPVFFVGYAIGRTAVEFNSPDVLKRSPALLLVSVSLLFALGLPVYLPFAICGIGGITGSAHAYRLQCRRRDVDDDTMFWDLLECWGEVIAAAFLLNLLAMGLVLGGKLGLLLATSFWLGLAIPPTCFSWIPRVKTPGPALGFVASLLVGLYLSSIAEMSVGAAYIGFWLFGVAVAALIRLWLFSHIRQRHEASSY